VQKPVCKKCELPHWRFQKCELADGYVAPPKPVMPVPVFHSHSDRRLGSRLTTLDQTAPSTFMRKRDA
jgi:hypothetical protein